MTSGLSKYRSFAREFKPRSLDVSGGTSEESVVNTKVVEEGMSGSLSPIRKREEEEEECVSADEKTLGKNHCTRTFTHYTINDELICVAVPEPGSPTTRSGGQDAFLTRRCGGRRARRRGRYVCWT